MSDLVSVILLSYNNLEYLESSLRSIFIQNYPNIELIIGDDGTHDFSYEHINKLVYSLKKSNVKNVYIYTNKLNEGTVKNFNKAIKMSNGEIIIPLACDDEFYDENVVTAISEEFSRKKCLICTAQRAVINEKDKVIQIKPNKKEAERYFNDSNKNVFLKICRQNIIAGSCTYYNKKVFRKYGLFDEQFKVIEDFPYYMDFVFKGGKIDFLNIIAIKYRSCGVTSKLNEGNNAYREDIKKIFERKILPRKKYIKRSVYRYWYYMYKRIDLKNNKFKNILNNFRFLDIVIIIILRIIRERVISYV